MSFQAISIVDGEAVEGIINNIEQEGSSSPIFKTKSKYEMTPGSGEGIRKIATNVVSSGDLGVQSGVISTATNNGFAVRTTSEVKDSSLVTVGGMEMTAKSAAMAGFLTQNSDGSYSEVGVSKKSEGNLSGSQVPEDQSHTSEHLNPALFDSTVERHLDALADDLGGYDALDRHALSAIAGLSTGDLSGAVNRLASEAGGEQEEADTFIHGVYERFKSQSENYITRTHGVNGDKVIEWASNYLPAHERASIMHQIYLGKSNVLDDLVSRYKKATR